eukprot:jgi/Psemu1/67819/estExt_Genemark1.C_3740031
MSMNTQERFETGTNRRSSQSENQSIHPHTIVGFRPQTPQMIRRWVPSLGNWNGTERDKITATTTAIGAKQSIESTASVSLRNGDSRIEFSAILPASRLQRGFYPSFHSIASIPFSCLLKKDEPTVPTTHPMLLFRSWLPKLSFLAAATFAVLVHTPRALGAALDLDAVHAGPNLLDRMRDNDDLDLLVYLIELAGAEDLLEDPETDRMVLAPINNAFLDVRTELMVQLLTDESWDLHLLYFLKHHLVRNYHHPFEVAAVAGTGGSIVLETLTEERIELRGAAPGDNGAIVAVADDGTNGAAAAALVPGTTLASNGAVYPVDAVLSPRWFDSDLEDLLRSDPGNRFSTLLRIGRDHPGFAAAISSVVSEDEHQSPYTIFAPTNRAFSSYSLPASGQAWSGLGWHVVPGIHTGRDLLHLSGSELDSIEGRELSVTVDWVERTLRINGSLVLESNLLANNGIVHVLDATLAPLPRADFAAVDTVTTTPAPSGDPTPVPSGDPTPAPTTRIDDDAKASGEQEQEQQPPDDCASAPASATGCPSDSSESASAWLDSDDYHACLLSKVREESRGAEVHCDCRPVQQPGSNGGSDGGSNGGSNGDGLVVGLSCREEATYHTNTDANANANANTAEACAPFHETCATGRECCSYPLRRCRGGICRDAVLPGRPHGSKHKLGFGTGTGMGEALIGGGGGEKLKGKRTKLGQLTKRGKLTKGGRA